MKQPFYFSVYLLVNKSMESTELDGHINYSPLILTHFPSFPMKIVMSHFKTLGSGFN